MDLPGITVVPIRQMSGGSSFNEVFFDDVRVPDRYRLGAVGEGWKVALTTLGFERSTSGADRGDQAVGGSWSQVRALAEHLGVTGDPVTRQQLAGLYAARPRAHLPGRPQSGHHSGRRDARARRRRSSKLLWTQWMTRVGDVTAGMLGPRHRGRHR